MRTRVKICGITRPVDGLVAAQYGADAIGLVFYASSPRAVTIEQAQAVTAQLPPFVSVVGLFVNATEQEVGEVLSQVPLDLLQFHGDEEAEYCGRFGRPYIKAISMREDVNLVEQCDRYAKAAGILLDTFHKDMRGGSGESFDWSRIPRGLSKPLILAGGLNPDNVVEAIQQIRPYAIDVSSGVEQSKGIKDKDKIAALIRGVSRVQFENE